MPKMKMSVPKAMTMTTPTLSRPKHSRKGRPWWPHLHHPTSPSSSTYLLSFFIFLASSDYDLCCSTEPQGRGDTMVLALPPEMLLLIFSCLPEQRRSDTLCRHNSVLVCPRLVYT